MNEVKESAPYFCTPFDFTVGKELILALSRKHGVNTMIFGEVLFMRTAPCIVVVQETADCDGNGELLRIINHRMGDDTPTADADLAFREHIAKQFDIACSHWVVFVAVSEKGRNNPCSLMREVERLFCACEDTDALRHGADPLSGTLGIDGLSREDHMAARSVAPVTEAPSAFTAKVQTSNGWDPDDY